jgi:ribonuclease HI
LPLLPLENEQKLKPMLLFYPKRYAMYNVIMKYLNIYCDGACRGNQHELNTGGWGAILEYGKNQKELHGGEADTTNNRMELTALICALSAITRKGERVRVFSDSSYVINCLNLRWYEKWQRNGWKTTSKTPVENRDLWEKLIALVCDHDFSFYHIKGHVNPDHPSANMNKHFDNFVQKNGKGFTFEEFTHLIRMNNRADLLANVGASEIKNGVVE